jgi:hypothetical protein
MMNQREKRLEALGYPLYKTTPEVSLVDVVMIAGDILYASGQVPYDGNVVVSVGW